MERFIAVTRMVGRFAKLLQSNKMKFEYKETDYDTLQKDADELMTSKKLLIFSIFKDKETVGEKWYVTAPDIKSDDPVIEGDVVFYSEYWRVCAPVGISIVKSDEYTNPTWADIINAANKMLNETCRYGLYLEGLSTPKTINGQKRIEFIFGS